MKGLTKKAKTKRINRPDILIVLGAANNIRGVLSDVAIGRAETAIKEYQERAWCKILLTGGYGKHFNTTRQPHARYMAKFLVANGVAPEDLLEFAESSSTMEDAILSRKILQDTDVGPICVITSGFHMERTQLIFNRAFPDQHLVFIEAPYHLSSSGLQRVLLHEQEALRQLREAQS